MDKSLLLSLVKSLEWSGIIHGMCFSQFGSGPELEACPSCHGARPTAMAIDHLYAEYIGHKPGCDLLRAINELAAEDKEEVGNTRKWLESEYPDTMVMDGYDDAIIGICHRYGFSEPVVAYDKERVIECLIKDGMSLEEAEVFHEYNQLGAWVGEGTPVFLVCAPTVRK